MLIESIVLPNLLIVGAEKCGTTSLHNYLSQHPDISMSEPKELNYFSSGFGWSNWHRGFDWYRKQFSSCGKLAVRGESSVSYTRWDIVDFSLPRIFRAVPDVKLVYLLRDPIERIISVYCHLLDDPGWPAINEATPLNEILRRGEGDYYYRIIVYGSKYGKILEKILKYFRKDKILVMSLFNESRLEDILKMTCIFLNVDYRADYFEEKRIYNSKKGRETPRNGVLASLLTSRTGESIAEVTPECMKFFARRVIYKKNDHNNLASIDSELHNELVEMFSRDLESCQQFQLKKLVGWKSS